MHFIPAPLANEFMDTIPFMTAVTREALEQSYADFKKKWWPATRQSPEIITAASYALRSGELGITAKRVVLTGLSQTGGVTRRFITHSSHLRLPGGGLPFEAFIPCQSGGAALPDVPGAKIIELLGESEFQSVRLPCGVSGQILGVSHRRADSVSFRLYEVAGMAHRESRYLSDIDKKRWSVAELNGANWSTFPNSFIYHAVFEAMERWTSDEAIAPPCGSTIQTIGLSDEIVRDDHGNAMGGVRSLHTDVPLSRIVAATPKGRPNWYCGKFVSYFSLYFQPANDPKTGSEWSFTPETLQRLYGTVSNYRCLAGLAIRKQIRAGFLLPEDAEVLRRETIETAAF